MFNFEKLTVWHRALAFAGASYRLSASFPHTERFGLTNQIRRAATSIASNLAEGSARPKADFAKFIGYINGSLCDVITQAAIARDQGYVGPDAYSQLYRDADEISRMLSGLRKSLE